MSDFDGTDAQDSGALEAAAQGQSGQTDGQPAGGSNPAWDELRSEVGDTTFHLMRPHLTKWDQQAQQRITAAQAEAKRYTELGDYDTLSAYRNVANQIDTDPTGFYQRMGEELRTRGLLEGDLSGVDPDEDEVEEDDDPQSQRIAQLEAMLGQFLGNQEQQQTAQQVQSWRDEWDDSFDAAKATAPWLSDDDDEILRALAGPLFSDTDDVSVTFQKALASLSNLRNRTLSAPRAGDSAPRLIPSGGGNPAAQQQPDVNKLDRRSTVDLVTARLKALRDQG